LCKTGLTRLRRKALIRFVVVTDAVAILRPTGSIQ
jgi:hypothetical protein